MSTKTASTSSLNTRALGVSSAKRSSALPEVPGRRPLWAAEIYGPSAECSITALLENHAAGGGGERLAGDGDPVAGVQRGLLGALGVGRRDGAAQQDDEEAEAEGL